MSGYTLDEEQKIIRVHKDCKKCAHIKVCVFHENMRNLAKQDVMYRMNQYLEWNNVLTVFELHSSCMHYMPTYTIPAKGEAPTLKIDPEIIQDLVRCAVSDLKKALLQEKYPEHVDNEYFFYQPTLNVDIPNDIFRLILKTTNKEIGFGTVVLDKTYVISEVLNQWKFE